MPQFIFFALVGVVAYVGYRAFVKEAERVNARMQRARQEQVNKAQGTLVKDPETGVYRPAQE